MDDKKELIKNGNDEGGVTIEKGDAGVDRSQTSIDNRRLSQDNSIDSSVKTDNHSITQTTDNHSYANQDNHSQTTTNTANDSSQHVTNVGGNYMAVTTVTCPICRRNVQKDTTFRCAKCSQDVCLTHKDKLKPSYCVSCAQLVSDDDELLIGYMMVNCQHCGDKIDTDAAFNCRRCRKFYCKAHRDDKWQVCRECAKKMEYEEKLKRGKNNALIIKFVGAVFSILIVAGMVIYSIERGIDSKGVENSGSKTQVTPIIPQTGEETQSTGADTSGTLGPETKPFETSPKPPKPPPSPPKPEPSLPEVVQQIELLKNGTSDFQMSFRAGKSEYRIGEKMRFFFKTDKECYLTIIDIGTSGNVTVIFPNQFCPDNLISAGLEHPIPGADYPFQLEVGGPAGLGKIIAIASSSPSGIGNTDYSAGSFRQIMRGDRAGTRDIKVYKDEVEADRKSVASTTMNIY